MKKIVFFSILIIFLNIGQAYAKNFEYNTDIELRALYGYFEPAEKFKNNTNRNHAPLYGDLKNKLTYIANSDLEVEFNANLKAQTGNNLDNLNQDHWGEEVYIGAFSKYGDFYFGQMENSSAMLGINKANLKIWQPTPTDIVNFAANPNWSQKNKNKYYATINSTLSNTDGSALKFVYLTPEYKNTTLGFTFTPENNADDGLISKFSSYYGKSSYTVSLHNYQEFDYTDAEFYLSYADYKNSHFEYAGGFLLYRKGWSLFGSYRKTNTSSSDKPIAKVDKSANRLAYYDGFRKSEAYNLGISYEFAYVTSTFSYFDSFSNKTRAKNRIYNLHNSLKFDKNYALYLGFAYVDFISDNGKKLDGNKGLAAYTGVEFKF